MCFLVYKIDINGSYYGRQNLNYKPSFSGIKIIDKGVDKVIKRWGLILNVGIQDFYLYEICLNTRERL